MTFNANFSLVIFLFVCFCFVYFSVFRFSFGNCGVGIHGYVKGYLCSGDGNCSLLFSALCIVNVVARYKIKSSPEIRIPKFATWNVKRGLLRDTWPEERADQSSLSLWFQVRVTWCHSACLFASLLD